MAFLWNEGIENAIKISDFCSLQAYCNAFVLQLSQLNAAYPQGLCMEIKCMIKYPGVQIISSQMLFFEWILSENVPIFLKQGRSVKIGNNDMRKQDVRQKHCIKSVTLILGSLNSWKAGRNLIKKKRIWLYIKIVCKLSFWICN